MKEAEKLGVTKADVKDIKRERFKTYYVYPLAGAVIAICSTLLGFFAGKANAGCTNCDGYPYAAGLLAVPKKKLFIGTLAITILVSVIGFATAYQAGKDMFSAAILYNSYRKCQT